MLQPNAYDHPVGTIELIETHISWVVLTGSFAYKIKKPVDFGFLDFSTLEKRQQLCEQEVQLNRRLAPGIYLEVVPITGTQEKPKISAQGEAFEYAVKMLQFPQSAQLDNMLVAGELSARHMDDLAVLIANFHLETEVADSSMKYGNKDLINYPVEENYRQISEHLDTAPYEETLTRLKQWSRSEFEKLGPTFEQRKINGYVRGCHGDMHLRNLVWLNDKPMAFDCIEFNPLFRWIDVISEVAFLVMDLQSRQQHHLANRFLNRYLECTGDYSSLSVFPFYLCYRALVRAKVDALRIEQTDICEIERKRSIKEFQSYLDLSITYTKNSTAKLIIMYGLSASGKSTLSQQLVDKMGAVRIRSDVERKRLFNISLNDDVSSDTKNTLYSERATQKTYTKLLEFASHIIRAGYSVIVDAVFLRHAQRELFQQLASDLDAAYIILEISADIEVLRQRIKKRKNDVSDADIAVLEGQIRNREPLHENEKKISIYLESEDLPKIVDLIELIDKSEKKHFNNI